MARAAPTIHGTDRRRQRQPHLIFALADDLGHANVGWNTNGTILTPQLDELRKWSEAVEAEEA